MKPKLAYLFDVDGTLTDTAPSHISFCNDLNREFSYGLPIIDIEDKQEVRQILSTPMRNLLKKYGFPEHDLDKLVLLYKERFSKDQRYKSSTFLGIPEMLEKLKQKNITLGIVTSNTESNVKRDLGDCFNFFNFCLDHEHIEKHAFGRKGTAISHAIWNNNPDSLPRCAYYYIGDTMSDLSASWTAECRFIGVTYGWELSSREVEVPSLRYADKKIKMKIQVANSVEELENILMSLR